MILFDGRSLRVRSFVAFLLGVCVVLGFFHRAQRFFGSGPDAIEVDRFVQTRRIGELLAPACLEFLTGGTLNSDETDPTRGPLSGLSACPEVFRAALFDMEDSRIDSYSRGGFSSEAFFAPPSQRERLEVIGERVRARVTLRREGRALGMLFLESDLPAESPSSAMVFWVSLGLSLLLAAGGGWFLTGLVNLSRPRSPRSSRLPVEDRPPREEMEPRITVARDSKSRFASMMGREMRGPMDSILGMTQQVLGTELSEEQQNCLDAARRSAESLLRMIDDFVEVSGSDPVPRPREFALRELAEEALERVAARAHEKGLELVCDSFEEDREIVSGDRDRLLRVLTHLLEHAVSSTEFGEVVLRVEREPWDEVGGQPRVLFTVRDTGNGIPEEFRREILGGTSRPKDALKSGVDPSAFGLHLAAELLGRMGGEFDVEGIPGGGTRFRVWIELPFPLSRSLEAFEGLEDGAGLDPSWLEDLPILIIDDNKTNRKILTRMLANWSLVPEAAATGVEGIDRAVEASIQGRPFPLILLDGQMPEMDGFEVAERLRAETGDESLILMLTSIDQRPSEARLRELGVHEFLTKPVRQGELLDWMLRALKSRGFGSRSMGGAADDAWSRLGSLDVLLVEDAPVHQKVISKLLLGHGHRVTVVSDGAEALDHVDEDSLFDVILMDVSMPTLDGVSTTREIRRRESLWGRSTPIVGLTRSTGSEDRERGFDAGMDECVTKPVRAAALFLTLEKVLSTSGSSGMSQSPDGEDREEGVFERGEDDQRIPDGIDFEQALIYTEGDEEILREAMRIFLAESPEILARLWRALEGENPRELARTAHSLKGLALSLAARGTIEACLDLERGIETFDADRVRRLIDVVEVRLEEAKADLREYLGPDVGPGITDGEPLGTG